MSPDAKELVEFSRMDLRGRIALRTLLLGWLGSRYRRVRQLQAYYATLLHLAELKTTATTATGHFSFLATSMTTGDLCQFIAEGFDDGVVSNQVTKLIGGRKAGG